MYAELVEAAPKHGARPPRKGYMAAETKNQKKVEKKIILNKFPKIRIICIFAEIYSE